MRTIKLKAKMTPPQFADAEIPDDAGKTLPIEDVEAPVVRGGQHRQPWG
jgi:hypothetical protein